MWKTCLQEKEYKQKYPNYFLLYFAFLNITRIWFRPHACAIILGVGVIKKKKKYHIVRCEKNAEHELSLVARQIPAPNKLWLVVLYLLYSFPRVSLLTVCSQRSFSDTELDATTTSDSMKELNFERSKVLLLCDFTGHLRVPEKLPFSYL